MEATDKAVRKVRCHFAARMIAFHVTGARNTEFSNFIPNLVPSYIFSDMKSWPATRSLPAEYKPVIVACLQMWPADQVHTFSAFPILRYLRAHTAEERVEIVRLLKEIYGYPIEC